MMLAEKIIQVLFGVTVIRILGLRRTNVIGQARIMFGMARFVSSETSMKKIIS